MKDIEIARSKKLLNIKEIAKKLDLSEDQLIFYGDHKAKIKNIQRDHKGKLILVTAISPTPYGEGKTTVSIGLIDALAQMKKKVVGVLRQPSMGPVFGMKGGATGGGYSQVVPMEDINLHFTGDFHAITAANNLLCAAIDNHIYFGNSLDIQKVCFRRCLDVNDRALRKVTLSHREEEFSITAASEIMSIFCLAESLEDLKKKLGNIVIGYNSNDEMIYARDLHVEGSMTVLLKDAFLPNLVQTLEETPVIVHGGPFANIAHGCNSVVATKCGLMLGDYVVTEAGFGADLGAEKFFNIKCRLSGIEPDAVVLVATIKALKYHGGVSKEKIYEKNIDAVQSGLTNLIRHVENLKKQGVPVVVCLNQYSGDSEDEIQLVQTCCNELKIPFSISTAYLDGGKGAIDLAEQVINSCSLDHQFQLLYDDSVSIKEKIEIVSREVYRASDVKYTDEALSKIEQLEKDGLSYLPICVAKTQYSFSDNPKLLGAPDHFSITVSDVHLYCGAGFITVLLGNIMVMPGLSRNPNYENIDFIDGKIIGVD